MIYSRSGGTSVLPCTHPWAVRRRRWPPALACTGWLTSTDEGIVPLRVRDGSNEPGAPWKGASARSASPRRRARQDARNPCAVSTNPASDRPDWGPRAVLVRHAQRTDQLPARVVTVVRPAQGETAGAPRRCSTAGTRRPVLPADAGRRCPWTLRPDRVVRSSYARRFPSPGPTAWQVRQRAWYTSSPMPPTTIRGSHGEAG